jgi:ribose 5-phosphate isomerase RpiB
MRIAVINEVSAVSKNEDILNALKGRGHEVFNVGMSDPSEEPLLLYNHTGLMTGMLLHTGRVDFVVGGCGTGQGFLNACMQYPGVFCGHILTPVDAWLFTQINGGNCISLALNQGYGWAGDVNLRFIFDRIFSVERGSGYPKERAEPQEKARTTLEEISKAAHKDMADIVSAMPGEIVEGVMKSKRFTELLDADSLNDSNLVSALRK